MRSKLDRSGWTTEGVEAGGRLEPDRSAAACRLVDSLHQQQVLMTFLTRRSRRPVIEHAVGHMIYFGGKLSIAIEDELRFSGIVAVAMRNRHALSNVLVGIRHVDGRCLEIQSLVFVIARAVAGEAIDDGV